MIYKERDELAIIELSQNEDYIFIDKLEEMILDCPSNIIYFEYNEKLYGIITMGDIARDIGYEGSNKVIINTHFTTLRACDYMRARYIFNKKDTIHNLPVTDENGVLIGEWARWDDILYSNYMSVLFPLKRNGNKFLEKYHVALVHPRHALEYQRRAHRGFCESLTCCGVEVDSVDYDSVIGHLNKVDFILFMTEDEKRAFGEVYKHLYQTTVGLYRIDTVYNFLRKCFLGKTLEKLRGGVVYNLVFTMSEYCKKLSESLHEKLSNVKIDQSIPPEIEEDFFDDLYTPDYAAAINNLNFEVESLSGKAMLKDCSGEFYNVINGERVTCGCPEEYLKTIYFVGPCFIYGHYVEDSYTIESFLQAILNTNGYKIRVVNCGSPAYREICNGIGLEMARIMDLPLKAGDILLIYTDGYTIHSVPEIDLINSLEEKNIDGKWLVDNPKHGNHKVNEIWAETIYEVIKPILLEDIGKDERIFKSDSNFIKTLYIEPYFPSFNLTKYDKIGAIVMNCNPFTYGHRYLIEQAMEKVNFLIIFVVEENRSAFSFLERFAMVTEGTADLVNVMVVPSGPYILSQTTFPEYFVKAADEDLEKNTENDITIFAEKIAPHLNIKYRFVGEEPEDAVTSQYNDAMKKILPEHGIELIEIPRKEQDGRYISASFARKCLEDNDMDGFKMLVPESTVSILFQK